MGEDKRLRRLEKRIKKLELEYETFDTNLKKQYIDTILERYDHLIRYLCNTAHQQLNLSFIDSDDLKQEFLEYLLKWTYCESKRRAFNGCTEIWVPFLKRSFKNFIINFQISHKKGGKRRPLNSVVSLASIEEGFLETKLGFKTDDLHETIELKEFIRIFYSNLENKIDRKVFKLLITPSPSFIDFSLKNVKKFCTFELMARYIGLSYSSIRNSHNRIRKNFLQTLKTYNYVS